MKSAFDPPEEYLPHFHKQDVLAVSRRYRGEGLFTALA